MKNAIVASALLSLVFATISTPVDARGRFNYHGPHGNAAGTTASWNGRGAGAAAGNYNGAYGNSIRGGGAGYYGPRGAAGAGAYSANGRYGGTMQGAGGGFITPNSAGAAGRFSGNTANGGQVSGSGAGAWKRGVGGAEATNLQGTTANGNAYNGYTRGAYNAQTGQGVYNSGKSVTNAQTGQEYGYNQSTEYTKGQGAQTDLNTANKGSYEVDWQKGQKPVVTPTTPQ